MVILTSKSCLISPSQNILKIPFFFLSLRAIITCLKMHFINIAILGSRNAQEMY